MRLVLTPPPHPTECVSGYLLRLGSTNGYATPYCLVRHVQRDSNVANFYRVTPDVLVDISGLPLEQSKRLCIIPEKVPKRGTVRLLSNDLYVEEVDLRKMRVCPRCIADNGRHEAIWHMKTMTHCPIHRMALLDRCKACASPLLWNRPSVRECNCGADLAKQGTRTRCSRAMADLLQALRAVFYQDEAIQPFPERLRFLNVLDAYAFSRMIIVLCELHEKEAGKERPHGKAGDITEFVGKHMESVADILSDWPHSFQRFLKEKYEAVLIKDEPHQLFRNYFAWAFFYLQKHLKVRGKAFTFLTDEIYRFGADYWSRDRLLRGQRAVKLLPGGGCWGSIPEAAAIMKMDPRAVMKRIAAGQIPVRRQNEIKRNRNVMVDMNFAREWKSSSHPPVPTEEAAQRIGINVCLLTSLCESRHFEPKVHTTLVNGHSLEDIERYRNILLKIASAHSPDGTIRNISYRGMTLNKIKLNKRRLVMLRTLMDSYGNCPKENKEIVT